MIRWMRGCGIILGLFLLGHTARGSMIIAGFDASRGGLESFPDSYSETGLRNAVSAAFAGATFSSTSTLTSAYLSTVNVLVVGVGLGQLSAIQPLDTAEQAALRQFVVNGGTAVIFADNDSFDVANVSGNQAPAANSSLLSPFGVHVMGTLTSNETATFTTSGQVLGNGPEGSATGLNAVFPGWFDNLGSAVLLATFQSNGQAAAAYLPAGSLGKGSGAAVFFADSSMMVDGYRTAGDTTVILNAIALGLADSPGDVPEPATFAMAGLCLGIIAARRRNRAAGRRIPPPEHPRPPARNG